LTSVSAFTPGNVLVMPRISRMGCVNALVSPPVVQLARNLHD
jgi:hypothetical protein